jgi:hypothetical protein
MHNSRAPARTHACTHKDVRTHPHTHTTHTGTHTHTQTHTRLHLHLHPPAPAHTRTQTHAHARTHTHTHAHTHTHTHTRAHARTSCVRVAHTRVCTNTCASMHAHACTHVCTHAREQVGRQAGKHARAHRAKRRISLPIREHGLVPSPGNTCRAKAICFKHGGFAFGEGEPFKRATVSRSCRVDWGVAALPGCCLPLRPWLPLPSDPSIRTAAVPCRGGPGATTHHRGDYRRPIAGLPPVPPPRFSGNRLLRGLPPPGVCHLMPPPFQSNR